MSREATFVMGFKQPEAPKSALITGLGRPRDQFVGSYRSHDVVPVQIVSALSGNGRVIRRKKIRIPRNFWGINNFVCFFTYVYFFLNFLSSYEHKKNE